MPRVEIQLDDIQLSALRLLAAERDVSPGQVIRDCLDAEIRRTLKPAKTPNRADERLVAPLRALLADDLAFATSWDDLQARLHRKGFHLAESGGGLVLLRWPGGMRLCKGSELGYPYRKLTERFGRLYPASASAFNRSSPRS